MTQFQLYLCQRISALLMIPLVIGHIGVMIIAIQNGLSADEILSRTAGSIIWFLFYGLFVLAVSVHASIGLRTILIEWSSLSRKLASIISIGISLLLLGLGMRAVLFVTLLAGVAS